MNLEQTHEACNFVMLFVYHAHNLDKMKFQEKMQILNY